MPTPNDAPRNEKIVVTSEIADVLGVSRQTVNQMIWSGQFDTLELIGPVTRPQYIIKRAELDKKVAARKFTVAEAGDKTAS